MTAKELLNLPVIHSDEGDLWGHVVGLLRDPAALRMAWAVLRKPQWYQPYFILPFATGIAGPHILLHEQDIKLLTEVPEAIRAAMLPSIIGEPVLSWEGMHLGTVEDLTLDAEGNIQSLILEHGLPVDSTHIHAVGSKAIVLAREATPKPPARKKAETAKSDAAHTAHASTKSETPTPAPESAKDEVRVQNKAVQAETPKQAAKATDGAETDRQSSFLLGRMVTRDVYDAQGNIIARQGDTVTQSLIDTARAAGFLMALTVQTRPYVIDNHPPPQT